MRFVLGHVLFIGLLLTGLFLVVGQWLYPSRALGLDHNSAPAVQQDSGGPIATSIKELRKAVLNPVVAGSHGLDREQTKTEACPPTVRATRQAASALSERVGSGSQPRCVRSCMKGKSFDDAHAVLLCSSRCP